MSKSRHHYISAIQSEQLKLVKIQDSLENLIHRVNESINALKVEELQLRSSAVDAMDTSPLEPAASISSALLSASQLHDQHNIASEDFDINKIENVNKQEIDLGIYKASFESDVECEEDASD